MKSGADRVRVLTVIKGLGPGGAERLLVSLSRVADHQRFEHYAVYLLPAKNHLVAELERSGVGVERLHGHDLWDVRWLLHLHRILHQRRFDIVHVHSPGMAPLVRPLVRWSRRWSPARPCLFYTEHNLWESYGWPTRMANRLTYSLDDVHLAVSGAVRSSIGKPWRDSVEVVVHGVPTGETGRTMQDRQATRAALGIRPDDVVVGTVANHRREKDYPTLLAAARLVLDQAPRVRFLAAGQGPLTAEIASEHERLGLGDRFQLLGYRPDALEVMSTFDVFALSSVQEGLPVAVMEALSLGVPVVATAVGGIPDAVRSGLEGELVPPRRPDLLAAAILDLVADQRKRSRLGRSARSRAAIFDIQAASARIQQLYVSHVNPTAKFE